MAINDIDVNKFENMRLASDKDGGAKRLRGSSAMAKRGI